MVNKKGYLRTLEAVIAIVLIISFIFYLTPQSRLSKPETPDNIKNAQDFILERISADSLFRRCITGAVCSDGCKLENIDSFECQLELSKLVNENTPIGYDNSFIICDNTAGCTLSIPVPEDSDVYVNDVFIATSGLSIIDPHFLRLFIWQK